MAVSKKKIVKQEYRPSGKMVVQTENPDKYFSEVPSWCFKMCDSERWAFSQERIGDAIWKEILPKLQAFENQKWSEILTKAKKQNHSIEAKDLNPDAQKRLAQRHIEQDSIISLRLSATHRIYGYITGAVFNILWYDGNHGDNATCVCRSRLKHT